MKPSRINLSDLCLIAVFFALAGLLVVVAWTTKGPN